MKTLGSRDKDLEDVLAIITAQLEKLDLQYLQSTLGMLESVLDRNDLLPVLDDLIRQSQK